KDVISHFHFFGEGILMFRAATLEIGILGSHQ
ncbi:hypothetical protein CSUI_006129, partial [Cystoisospora suis]